MSTLNAKRRIAWLGWNERHEHPNPNPRHRRRTPRPVALLRRGLPRRSATLAAMAGTAWEVVGVAEIKEAMRELHLFAGAGGGILGGILLGHTCVCAVEIEPYCRKVLLQRQRDGLLPRFPIWDDVRTFDGRPWRGRVDVVCGGFPCQDISIAGNGDGITGERSGLWKEMVRVIGDVRSRYVFVENSPAITHRGLGVVTGDLVKLGYDCAWGIFSAGELGFEHERQRFFLHADSDQGNDIGIRMPNRSGQNQGLGKRIRRENSEQWKSRLCELDAMDVVSFCDSYAEGRRIFHGLANGMDRLGAIGNGQVPSVAALAWRTLT